MSYHEGSNWQAKKEDEKKPLYQPSVPKPVSKGCTLEELKPGTLFSFNGTIALKSEYYTATGAIEAFIVGSGEMFWGGTKDPKDQRKLIVSPIPYAAQFHPKPPTGSDAVEDWISVESGSPDCHRIDGKKKYINWVLGTNGKSQFVCVYTKGHELEYGDDDPSDEEYDEVEERNGCLYLKPGWYELEETPGGQYDETWVKRKVTHYRPLPQPPK